MSLAMVYLAAGKGTRMCSDIPKVLHPLGQVPMLAHAMKAGKALDPERSVVVVGHGAEAVRKSVLKIDPTAEIVLQNEQLGTGHAIAQTRAVLRDFKGDICVLYGDTPFIQPKTLRDMCDARQSADIVVLGFEAQDPGRYGRLVVSADGTLERIVEYKDATDEEKRITLCNSGMMMGASESIFALLAMLTNDNASGEYYATDIPALGRAHGLKSVVVRGDEIQALGINSRSELARAEAFFQNHKRQEVMENGVTLFDPQTVYFSLDTIISQDCVIEPNVVFGPGVSVGKNVTIKSFSHIEGARISNGATIGPFARLRPGTDLGQEAKVGNFVEVKNAKVEDGAKINHLSYVGDASVGTKANIGAGTVTCNYDGVLKHRTDIGAGAFIGSGSMLVAPVKIGEDAMIGSGSVITKDVESEALGVARARQINKEGFAAKFRKMLLSRKKNMNNV
ncbi:MAG: bifunctional UDP-N-acetylglucosamine diphosphorylase/glucosamine-1-phosphate N-acetyltransferase GlmU [Paracoccaceae bacterium]